MRLTSPVSHTPRVVRAASSLLLAALVLALLAACGTSSNASSSGGRHALTLGLTYIKNVQFAPFYVAQELGYYRAAGLDVTLRHHSFTEGEFDAVASGTEDAVFAGGDEMLQARSKGLDLTYIASVFAQYPVTLIVPVNSPIHSPADLRGHTIGTPGPYGETYFGLLALLQKGGLKPSDVTIQSIGFTQASALISHKVDAVMGYSNNEPIQFQQANFAVRTLPLSVAVPSLPLVSNGLGATRAMLSKRPGDMKALVAATLRGVQYTLDHPQQAFDICKKYVPGLTDPKTEVTQLVVLRSTLPVWQSIGARLGYNDPATWQAMGTFMVANGLLATAPDITKAVSNDYLPK